MAIISTTNSARNALLKELAEKTGASAPSINAAVANYEESIGIEFKKKIISIVIAIFLVSVITLWLGLWWVADQEYQLIKDGKIPLSDRIITENLLLSLITGTVAQVAISFGLMMKYLFSSKSLQIIDNASTLISTPKTP